MSSPSPTFLVHGTDTPSAPPRPLRAGPLWLDYDSGDLRCVKLGEREILRRIGGAVRDRNWDTVPGILSEERIEASGAAFRITYTSTHRKGGIHFVWHAALTGDADGTLRFTFDGEAKTNFLRNRIGMCVLHPIRECAGARVRALLADGTGRELVFPEMISAEQPVRGFDALSGLAHEVTPGVWVEVRFTGEVFETEDQRNWIDASFKTYGTPLTLPFPVEVKAGTRLRQSVEVRLQMAQPAEPIRRPLAPVVPVHVEVSTAGWVRLPELGLGCSNNPSPENSPNKARLEALPLSHLRTDVRLADGDGRQHLQGASLEAATLGLPLELALHLPSSGEIDQEDLRAWFGRYVATASPRGLKRILVFCDGEKSTTPAALATVRQHLGDLGVPIGAGTDANLCQLNLQRPPPTGDFICWSMNPQVHAADSRSLLETPEAAAAQVASVKTYFPGAPLVVSPITLKPRFNPAATSAVVAPSADELPPQVDPRQMSLVGAAWLVAMLAALAPSGVESLTFFETTGWRGVMESAFGSPLPDKFPSFAGGVFPVWHVFAALTGFHFVVAATVSDPQRVAAFAVADQTGRRRLLLANRTASGVEVTQACFGGAARVLDESNVADAMREPEAWWRRPGVPTGETLWLSAFAVAFVDETSPYPCSSTTIEHESARIQRGQNRATEGAGSGHQ